MLSIFHSKTDLLQVIVSHPVNPPYYVPLVEVVPAPWTKPEVIAKTKAVMLEIGQEPVVLGREIDGFILNRIQYVYFQTVITVICILKLS